MDEQTLENLATLGVEVPNKEPIKVNAPTAEEVQKVVDEANKQIPAADIGDGTGDGKVPNDAPEVNQPEVPTDAAKAPEEPVKGIEEPEAEKADETVVDETNLDDILNTLEDLSKDSLADIEKATNANNKKIKKVAVPDNGLSKEQSKSIQEIVDLNVKLQNELSVSKISEAAKERKIQEQAEKLSFAELDDSKEEVLGEVKGINKYLKQYKATGNESFKVKATQEALDFLEQTRGVPLRGDYLGDRITESLQAVAKLTEKSADDIGRDANPQPEDANRDYILAHGIGL